MAITSKARRRLAILLLGFGCLPAGLSGQVEITLKNTFIERFKNRVTIDATYTVDHAHPKPNPPTKDGDLHIAGRAPEIGLATVAEIMNAASDQTAVDLVHTAEGSGIPIPITGAWRIWAEHGGETAHVQGQTVPPATNTNPDHIFEIHPILRVGDHGTLNTWTPIDGYDPKEASNAFERYENKFCHIEVKAAGKTKITTAGLGFNYVRFKIVLLGDQKVVEDGRFVFAEVLDLNDELLVRKRRMVFAKDTPAEIRVRALQAGDTLEVLGIPRVDLALVAWRTSKAASRPEVLSWRLPYEMIIVGTYQQ